MNYLEKIFYIIIDIIKEYPVTSVFIYFMIGFWLQGVDDRKEAKKEEKRKK